MTGLPVTDISELSASDPAARGAVGEVLRPVCLEHGFFYCTGHGMPDGLIDAAMAQTQALFDLPEAVKLAIDKALGKAP